MSTRITKYSNELLQKVVRAWVGSSSRMFDLERAPEAALYPISEEPNTQFYALPGDAFLLLRNAQAGQTAVVQIITPDGKSYPDLEETKRVLSEAVREYRLRRVSLVAPAGTEWRDYKLLGFKHEGRIRLGGMFDNQYTDIEMLGALEHEVGKGHRRQRKRYRPKKQQFAEKVIYKTPPPEESNAAESE